MTDEANPYPQGSYAHAQWNLHKAQKQMGVAVADALRNWSRNLETARKARRWNAFSSDELQVIVDYSSDPENLADEIDAAALTSIHREIRTEIERRKA